MATTPVNKKRILLVDDNDDVRAVFQEGLEAYGFEVVAAAGVNEALRLISTEKFDVLLSDLHMPDAKMLSSHPINDLESTQPVRP
jgi:CheY-like chemotaxis protein